MKVVTIYNLLEVVYKCVPIYPVICGAGMWSADALRKGRGLHGVSRFGSGSSSAFPL